MGCARATGAKAHFGLLGNGFGHCAMSLCDSADDTNYNAPKGVAMIARNLAALVACQAEAQACVGVDDGKPK